MEPQALYLSKLLGSRVTDAAGTRLGWVGDVVIRQGQLFPTVTALLVRRPGAPARRVAWAEVDTADAGRVTLRVPADRLSDPHPGDGEILLSAEVLDKQLVDTHGRRVVKVNDLKLLRIHRELRVLGVDVGVRGILRRLGAERATERLVRLVRPDALPEALIPWNFVESIPARGENVRLSVPSNRLERLHPADISRILRQLPAEERAAAVEQFSDETIAGALGELDSSIQRSLVDDLGSQRASEILERMAPDEAADLLQDLSAERKAELLRLMEQEDAAGLTDLLRYDERTAGGLMTPQYLALSADLTVEEAIARVRELSPSAEMIYYLYVVDAAERLMGVLSLRALITSPPQTRVCDIMTAAVVSVPASMDQEEVAATIVKYRLLAVPVVDEQHRLLGIVTVDDTIDVVDAETEEDLSHIAGTPAEDPEELQRGRSLVFARAPWLLLAVTTGLLAALLLNRLAGPLLTRAALFLPLIFLLGNQVAAQAAAATARGIALREINRSTWQAHSLAELRASALVALPAALGAAVMAGLWGGPTWALAVGGSALVAVLGGSLLGLLVPLTEAAARLDPAVALRPIIVSLMVVFSALVYALFLGAFVR